MAGASSSSQWRDLSAAWNAVIEFVAAVAVYGGLGWFADGWLGTGHVLFVVGLVLGMVLGIYVMMKRADQAEAIRLAARKKSDRASG